ncbi:hypothetical protein [Geoalkalibacter halelectricus]|uniref:Uncharacterized protein n=1 Tax=Geoalkalibacter halelectricus TaxID=2847045 RepID=A0ABY5ZPM0_9BACT|nr:hypothetical protein [Geoalkalibacter halelectricus]MDO3378862.1 hypothetical protein [Geoalkalibacter halelectricus]UWZ79835.1 hypothetical protein L9S41_00200 [Geoalkalibacter halelectricus]
MPHGDRRQGDFEEFARFVEAAPLRPRAQTDAAILRQARRGQNPSPPAVLGKFLAVQLSAGIATLAVCPQFGVGAAAHQGLLHGLHAQAHPALYYLTCGLIFVLFGALLSGLAANRRELKALGRGRHAYFLGYSICAYLTLMLLGSESFLLLSMFWIVGGAMGHWLGFSLGRRLKGLRV